MVQKRRILITGAAGKVGSTLWNAWDKEDKYTLTLMDIKEIEGAKRTSSGEIFVTMRECTSYV